VVGGLRAYFKNKKWKEERKPTKKKKALHVLGYAVLFISVI